MCLLQISCDTLLCSEVEGRELLPFPLLRMPDYYRPGREEIASRKVAFGAQPGSQSDFATELLGSEGNENDFKEFGTRLAFSLNSDAKQAIL